MRIIKYKIIFYLSYKIFGHIFIYVYMLYTHTLIPLKIYVSTFYKHFIIDGI